MAVSCTENTAVTPVRLVGGSSSTGRLEVFHDGVWGTVCGDFFTAAAASVVCNMLRLGRGTKIHNSNYITSEGPIWLDDVRCNGTETNIAECSHKGWGVHNCQHRDAIAISCLPTKMEVRLNGGRDPREGRLEVFRSGAWRSVCRDGFNDAAARVFCNMLGLGYVGRPTRNNYDYGRRSFWLQSVQCNGNEKSIAECVRRGYTSTCSPGEEQAVSCLAEGAVALYGSEHPRTGRLEVYHNGSWGTVCDNGFTDAAARVVCFSLGFGYGGYKKNAINYGSGTGRIWLDNVRCNGTERHISECSHTEWGVHDCEHDEDIAVLCLDKTPTILDPPDGPGIPIFATVFLPALFLILFIAMITVICFRRKRRQEHIEAAGSPQPEVPVVFYSSTDPLEPTAPTPSLPGSEPSVPVEGRPPSYHSSQSAPTHLSPPPRYSSIFLQHLQLHRVIDLHMNR